MTITNHDLIDRVLASKYHTGANNHRIHTTIDRYREAASMCRLFEKAGMEKEDRYNHWKSLFDKCEQQLTIFADTGFIEV